MVELTPSQKRRFERRRDWYPRGTVFRLRGSHSHRRPEMLSFGVYVSGGGPDVHGLCSVISNEGSSDSLDVRSLAPLNFVPDWEDFPMRLTLPYAYGLRDDGTEVLCDRDYRPICSRKDGIVTIGKIENLGGWEKYFYKECDNPPWIDNEARARCRAVLAEWGVRPRPWTGLGKGFGVELVP